MYHLATVFPSVRRIGRLPLSRDQLMLLMAAINEIFLGIDIYLAHSISGTIVPNEWIPIIFGPIAGVLLLLAGLIAILPDKEWEAPGGLRKRTPDKGYRLGPRHRTGEYPGHGEEFHELWNLQHRDGPGDINP